MLVLLHESHFGVSKTKARARTVFYWPNIDQDIEDVISKCAVCEMYRSKNVKEEILQYEIPELPFQSISSDILSYAGKDYVIIYDRFSKWLEICELKSKSAFDVIQNFKKIFSTHGLPETVVADNVPFNSFEFKEFAKSWNFTIITSSPFYPKSNGFAEKGVDISKTMLKKSHDTKIDIEFLLLEYRNTPIVNIGYTPSQMLMSRVTRTKMPLVKRVLEPKLCLDVKDKLEKINEKVKENYNKTAKKKNVTFKEGDDIIYCEGSGEKWKRGQVVQKYHTPRSWVIRNEKNNLIRRNSHHMRRSFNQPNRFNNFDYPENLVENNDFPTRSFNNNNEQVDQSNHNARSNRENSSVVNNNNRISRYGRIVRTPSYLQNNYIMY